MNSFGRDILKAGCVALLAFYPSQSVLGQTDVILFRPALDLAFIPGANRIVVSYSDRDQPPALQEKESFHQPLYGSIELWDLDTYLAVERIKFSNGYPLRVAVSPNGRWLATAGSGKTPNVAMLGTGDLRIYDVRTNREYSQLVGHESQVGAIAYSNDGKLLASASVKKSNKLGNLMLWNMDTNERWKSISAGSNIRQLKFVPGTHQLVSIYGYGRPTFAVWNLDSGDKIDESSEYDTGATFRFDVSPDGKFFASGGTHDDPEKHITIWTREGLKIHKQFQGHKGGAFAVSFSPDGKLLATAGNDGWIRLWSTHTWREVAEYDSDLALFNALTFSPDSSRLAFIDEYGVPHLLDVKRLLKEVTAASENENAD